MPTHAHIHKQETRCTHAHTTGIHGHTCAHTLAVLLPCITYQILKKKKKKLLTHTKKAKEKHKANTEKCKIKLKHDKDMRNIKSRV